jgi:phage terminase large subunit-like protein
VVVALDPPASAGPRADACGIVAAGVGADGRGYVLADASLGSAKPAEWAARAVATARRWDADAIVAEVNQGGEMVRAVLAQVDASVPIVSVHATRGKYLRADPVALLYEQGRVHHVGAFPELEDELCDFGPGGLLKLDLWEVSVVTFPMLPEARVGPLGSGPAPPERPAGLASAIRRASARLSFRTTMRLP